MTPVVVKSACVVFPQSKNTQRLGSLSVVSKLASPSRASSISDLARSYRSLLIAPIHVPPDERENILRFLSKRNLARKYSAGVLENVIESQDWLLADKRLPSRTGSEKEDVRPTIDLAAQVGLLWATTCQRTWAGDLLAEYTGDVVNAFRNGSRDENPFLVSSLQKTILGFIVIESDQTFLRFLVDTLLSISGDVDIAALIEVIRKNFDSFINGVKTNAKGPEDARILKQLMDLQVQILRPTTGRRATAGGITVQTLRRTFEALLYWRLEALVDLGLLEKPDPETYIYQIGKNSEPLYKIVNSDVSKNFFTHWFTVASKAAEKTTDYEEIRELLFAANQKKANSMGYTLIKEGVLVANLNTLESGLGRIVEVSDAVAAILKGTDQRFKVLTSVDRNRLLSAYKMVKN